MAEALERSGYNSAALNGDMNQALREQTLERLKDGRLDILIATDVAARGLTLSVSAWLLTTTSRWTPSLTFTVSAVPVVRVAGRALLFVENRERRLLRNIERTMKLTIPEASCQTQNCWANAVWKNSPRKYSSSWKAAIWISTCAAVPDPACC
ncbi:MAG: helicase-related protein [Enterobacter hormaechei]